MPSGPFMTWGLPGKGQWITVFANGGHAYAVIAGLRWDTSAVGEPGRPRQRPALARDRSAARRATRSATSRATSHSEIRA